MRQFLWAALIVASSAVLSERASANMNMNLDMDLGGAAAGIIVGPVIGGAIEIAFIAGDIVRGRELFTRPWAIVEGVWGGSLLAAGVLISAMTMNVLDWQEPGFIAVVPLAIVGGWHLTHAVLSFLYGPDGAATREKVAALPIASATRDGWTVGVGGLF